MNLERTQRNDFRLKLEHFNDRFLNNEMLLVWIYFGFASGFLVLSIPSYLDPYHCHYIILGGLIPLLIINLVILGFILASIILFNKDDFYKSWKFYITCLMIVCLIIFLPVAYHYLVVDYDKYADLFRGMKGPQTELVTDHKVAEITISIWFDIIFTFSNFIYAIVLTVLVWKENHPQNIKIESNNPDNEKEDANKKKTKSESASSRN